MKLQARTRQDEDPIQIQGELVSFYLFMVNLDRMFNRTFNVSQKQNILQAVQTHALQNTDFFKKGYSSLTRSQTDNTYSSISNGCQNVNGVKAAKRIHRF